MRGDQHSDGVPNHGINFQANIRWFHDLKRCIFELVFKNSVISVLKNPVSGQTLFAMTSPCFVYVFIFEREGERERERESKGGAEREGWRTQAGSV